MAIASSGLALYAAYSAFCRFRDSLTQSSGFQWGGLFVAGRPTGPFGSLESILDPFFSVSFCSTMITLVEFAVFSEPVGDGNSVSKSPPEPEAGASSADGSFAGAIDDEMSISSLALFSSCSSSGSRLFVSKARFKTACRFAALASASGNVHPS